MHTFSVPLLLPLLSLEKARGEPRTWQAKEPHLIPGEVMEQAILEAISRHMKDKQFLTSLSRSHRWQQHLVCLNQPLPTAAAGSWIQKQVCKIKEQPSNQQQISFLLFKAGLSTKNHAEEIVFSSKHNLSSVQLLTKQGTASCLATESAWSRSLACYKTELGSWLMPKEQQLE